MSPWAARGKAAQAVPLPWSWRANLAWSRGKSSQERLYNPHQLPEGCVLQQQGQCHSGVAGQEPCLWDPAGPLPIPPPRPPGSPGPVRAWGFCCSKCTQAALFWAETAAQQLLFSISSLAEPLSFALFLFHPPLLLLSFSLAQTPSLVSPSVPSSYLTPIFSVLSLLQCSYPEDRSQNTSSAIHLTDPKPLSQCDKCDLLILWRGCTPLLGSVAIPRHQPQGQTYTGGCSCLARSTGTTISSPQEFRPAQGPPNRPVSFQCPTRSLGSRECALIL